jgi:hypothetical protein
MKLPPIISRLLGVARIIITAIEEYHYSISRIEVNAAFSLLEEARMRSRLGGRPAFVLSLFVGVSLLLVVVAAPAAASPPTVEYGTPINATGAAGDTSITIHDGTLVVQGTATDPDGLSHLTIQREYTYDAGDDRDIERLYRTPPIDNGTFDFRVELGTGTNEVNLSVVDADGYPEQFDVVVHVDDQEPPTADLEARPDGEWVRLEGRVRDNVQVETVRVGDQTLQTQTGRLDIDREGVRIDTRVPRPDAANLTVTLVDRAGNSREVTVPVGATATATASATATPTDTPAMTATATATAAPTSNATTAASATPPPVETPTATPAGGGGGVGTAGLVGVIVVVGGGLLLLNAGGGGW